MSIDQYALVGLALALGGGLQSAIGFGGGLVAIPIMLLAGVPAPQAIVMSYMGSLVQAGWGWYRHRDAVPWRATLPMFFLRLATLPLGIWLLVIFVRTDPGRIKQLVGVILLVALAIQWIKVTPRAHVHWCWTLLAGATSGVGAGMIGVGGPQMVLWLMAHDWPNNRVRTFLWILFVQTIPFYVVMMGYQFGRPIAGAVVIGLMYAPLVVLASIVGLYVGHTMSRKVLRICIYLTLVVIAIVCITKS